MEKEQVDGILITILILVIIGVLLRYGLILFRQKVIQLNLFREERRSKQYTLQLQEQDRQKMSGMEIVSLRPDLDDLKVLIFDSIPEWKDSFLLTVANNPASSKEIIINIIENKFKESVPLGSTEIYDAYAKLNGFPPEAQKEFRTFLFTLGASGDPERIVSIILKKWLLKTVTHLEAERALAVAANLTDDAFSIFDDLKPGAYGVGPIGFRKTTESSVIVFRYPNQDVGAEYLNYMTFREFWQKEGYVVIEEWLNRKIYVE